MLLDRIESNSYSVRKKFKLFQQWNVFYSAGCVRRFTLAVPVLMVLESRVVVLLCGSWTRDSMELVSCNCLGMVSLHSCIWVWHPVNINHKFKGQFIILSQKCTNMNSNSINLLIQAN